MELGGRVERAQIEIQWRSLRKEEDSREVVAEEVVVEVQEDKKVALSESKNEMFLERRMAKVEKAEESEVREIGRASW